MLLHDSIILISFVFIYLHFSKPTTFFFIDYNKAWKQYCQYKFHIFFAFVPVFNHFPLSRGNLNLWKDFIMILYCGRGYLHYTGTITLPSPISGRMHCCMEIGSYVVKFSSWFSSIILANIQTNLLQHLSYKQFQTYTTI